MDIERRTPLQLVSFVTTIDEGFYKGKQAGNNRIHQQTPGEVTTMKTRVKAETLQLRDIVRSMNADEPFSCATVVKIDNERRMVYLFRPYVHCEDFSYTGGVIHYIGSETYPIWFDTDVELLERINDRYPLK